MIVRLSDVPHYERHLLHCTKLMPRLRSPKRRHRRDSASPSKPHSPTVTCTDTPPNLIPPVSGFDAAASSVGVA